MGPELVVALAIISFLVLIALEVPIALSIGAAGLLATALLADVSTAASTLGAAPYASSAKYALVVIPMYVLLGSLISHAGLGTRIFGAVNRMVHRLPGGLAATTVVATSVFSGISGSSAADVATFGRISVREMTRNGYTREYSAAVVAAAGAFAALIPPSVTIILYAILAEVSVSAMIMAGVVPGVLSATVLAIYVVLRGVRQRRTLTGSSPDDEATSTQSPTESSGGVAVLTRSALATAARTQPRQPLLVKDVPAEERLTQSGDLASLGYAAILFAIVIGGLYGGVFTATEAGAIGAFAALVIAVIARRSEEVSLTRLLWRSITEASQVTSMIFLLLIGGAIFSFALALSGVPTEISEWVGGLSLHPSVVVAIMLISLVPLGAFLDGLSILLLTVPVLAPIALELGFEGVWFGILVLKLIEVGLITPPVGVNAFIISSISGVPAERVFRALVPFVVLDLSVSVVLFAFPDLVLFLPRAAGLL